MLEEQNRLHVGDEMEVESEEAMGYETTVQSEKIIH